MRRRRGRIREVKGEDKKEVGCNEKHCFYDGSGKTD
jgi:hypothetical protein